MKDMTEVFKTLAEADACEDIFWRWDSKKNELVYLINCNDLFWWATADCEEINPEDAEELAQCLADLKAIRTKENHATIYMTYLWVSRKRKLRPQGAFYKNFDAAIAELFDTAGPRRNPDKEIFGNPLPNTPGKP